MEELITKANKVILEGNIKAYESIQEEVRKKYREEEGL